MSDRIQLTELERLLADDSTPDEILAKYLKPAPQTRGAPMALPTLVANEQTVAVPPSRGIVSWSIGFLNARGERRRIKAYQDRIAGGWSGLRLLAEGDSWFLYPIVLKDVIDHLETDYAIYAVAAAGDTLQNMVSDVGRLEQLIVEHKLDGLLFSAGGNDIAGDQLLSYLNKVTDAGSAAQAFVGPSYETFLSNVSKSYDDLFAKLTKRFPDLRIFCHGYDWVFPQKGGRWLWPAMSTQHVPEAVRPQVLRLMIDGFYAALTKVASKYDGRVTIVDCRGTVGELAEWYDELHPRDLGFGRAAQRFREAINAQFKDKPVVVAARAGAPEASPLPGPAMPAAPGAASSASSSDARHYTLQWHPHEDRTGGRIRSKIIPMNSSITVGRHSDRELMLDDDRVSRLHARLEIGDQQIFIEDLGSTNGTLIDGQRVKRAELKPGQEFRIGNFALKLEPTVVESDTVMMTSGQTPLGLMSRPVAEDVAVTPMTTSHLEIEFARGSITNVTSAAYVVGLFEHVRPTASRGPAREIDLLTNQWLSGVTQASAAISQLGKVSAHAIPGGKLKAPNLVLAGLGALTDFGPHCLETVGASLGKVLSESKVESFATVPIGTNTGCTIADFVINFSRGLVTGLVNAQAELRISKVTICEVDDDRFDAIKAEVKRLAATDVFRKHGVEVSFSEADVGGKSVPANADPGVVNQTLIHATSSGSGRYDFYTLPMSGAGLPIWTQFVDAGELTQLNTVIDSHSTDFDPKLGASLSSLYLPSEVQKMLASRLVEPDSHLLVIHDRGASSIPWEALYFDGHCPALESGVSRKCLVQSSRPSNAPLPSDSVMRMLLVYPEYEGGDGLAALPGAADEGILLARLFKENQGDATVISGRDATKQRILDELARGDYDILHYAGHAWFNQNDPRESGLLLGNQERITAADLDREASPPKLIFLNACESSRMRSGSRGGGLQQQRTRIEVSGGLAEGLLSIGVGNLIGTYWAVDDAAARLFAQAFYTGVLEGNSISFSLRAARKEVKEWSHAGNRMWANYLHFGDPTDKLRGTVAPLA